MAEIIKFPESDSVYTRRLVEIASEAQAEVASLYDEGAPQPLAYHNSRHTGFVMAAGRLLADAAGLDVYDTALVTAAAAAHDIVQLAPRGEMEKRSAEWLATRIDAAELGPEESCIAYQAVRGTEPLYNIDGFITVQRVVYQEYPSERGQTIAQIVACADMAELYQPSGPLHSLDLYKETQQGIQPGQEPVFDQKELLVFQLSKRALLESYQYPHDVGERLLTGLREKVIEHEVIISQDIALERISSWQELVERNQQFAARYAEDV
ncbi:MAG TPA: hypothetical protein VK983_03170 [Candidatus Limnocylindrales bacterium]|nr:hypothetical protein [Candidatus Limnocylindrales bacterium]